MPYRTERVEECFRAGTTRVYNAFAMALHPQCKTFLDILAAAGGPSLDQLPLADARSAARQLIEFGGPEEPVAQVADRVIAGPAQPIPVRIYRPVFAEQLPALLFFHGGGFVLGDCDTHDRQCRGLANASGCVVIAVDYRLAPEHKFPAAADDAYDATHPTEFGIDPARVAVGGDSAGANLATVVALMARDRGGPGLSFQLLIYPVTNFDDDSPSMREYANDHFLTRDLMNWFTSQYVASVADRRNPYASPAYPTDLHGLPVLRGVGAVRGSHNGGSVHREAFHPSHRPIPAMFPEPPFANREHRTHELRREPEPEHEPRSENREV